MKKRYLVSTRVPELKFLITHREVTDSGEVYLTLKGPGGVQFRRMVNDDVLERYGYEVRIEEEPDAVPDAA